jgi:predicted outer membrane repeat protein
MFSGNTAVIQRGGAIISYHTCSPVITNCTFSGNSAARLGGAVYSMRDSNPVITNCIMWADTAGWGGDEIALDYFSVGGAPPSGTAVTVSFSDVEGGAAAVHVDANCTLNWGDGNIDIDPCFVEPGQWDANGVWVEGDYHLLADSVCIDAGDPNYLAEPNETDLHGRPRVIGGRIDMGAYEFSMLAIEVEMRLVQQAINPGSKGNWVKAHFVLPEGFTVDDVDTSRPAEIEQFHIMSESIEVSVKDGLVAVVAVFDRGEFCSIGPLDGQISIVGYLTSGKSFRGTDTIKIVKNKIKHLAVVASSWLSVCSGPDWCDGADLDQDSVVNFVDVALLDGCCFEVIKD